MCGIAGFVNMDGAPVDAGVLDAMTDMVRHRGPDDGGTRCLSLRGGIPDTALGVRRLSILDRSDRGAQPMTTADGAIALAFNGAIYNAFDQRPALERDGYRFRSGTDTEVLLALYERHGLEGMLDRLEGMFAMVIVDTRQGAVHLIRDRVGIKPLYWTRCGETVLFASEAKAFLAHPAFRAEIDPAGIDELLAFRSIAGERSLLRGVRHVPPGSCLTIRPRGLTHSRYWDIHDDREPSSLAFDDAVARLDDVLGRSVRVQLRSDVRVGCQLSGGVDSSLVTTCASRQHPDGVPAFSIVVDDETFSEERWIAAAAGAEGTAVHRVRFGEPEFMAALDDASWHMDQPIGHPNALALCWLSRHARGHATVLLTGEGADELFGGYRRFAGLHAAADSAETFIRAAQFHSEARLSKLRPGADLRPALDKRRAVFHSGRGDSLANGVRYEMQTHLVDVLMRQDRMMMAHGIENRVPFLDRRVIQFARALPAGHLVGPAGTKLVVKALAARLFGDAFAYRRKSAFNLPLAQYFRSPTFIALMEDRLLPGMASRGIVDVSVVRRWWRRALSAPSTTEGFWIPVALELWAQQFVDDGGQRRRADRSCRRMS